MSTIDTTTDEGRIEALAAQVRRLESRLPAYPTRFVYLLLVVGAIDQADRSVISVVFEDIKRAFDVSDAQLGLVTAAFSVVATLSAVPFGWLADRWNRVWLIALGFIPWSLGMFGSAIATSFGMLFVVRLLLGTIEATNGPSTPSLLGDYYPVVRRDRIFGIERTGNIMGFVVGAAGGGVLASAFGWRAAFVGFGVAGLVCGYVVLRKLPEPERGLPDALHRSKTRLRQLQARAAEKPVAAADVLEGPDNASGSTAVATVEQVDLTPSEVDYRRLRTADALRRFARTPTLWVVLIAQTIQQFGTSALATWTPTFWRRYHGLDPAAAGGFVAFNALFSVAGVVIGGRIGQLVAQRYPPAVRIWLIAGSMFAAGGAFLVGFGADQFGVAALAFFAGAFFATLSTAPTFTLFTDVMVPHLRGKGFAVVAVSRVAGVAAAPVVFGILSDSYGLRAALLLMGPLALVGAVIVLVAISTYGRDKSLAQREAFRQHLLEESLGGTEELRPDDGGVSSADGKPPSVPSPSGRGAAVVHVLERGLTKVGQPTWVPGTDGISSVESGIAIEGTDPGAPSDVLLAVRGIDFSYGPLQVLFDVGLTVGRGERVGVLGTNGAGKSTLLGVISGLHHPSRGAVWFDGEDITRMEPHERVERGIMQIAGGRAIFPTLSLADNIRIGAYGRLNDKALVQSRLDEAMDVFPHLRPHLHQPAGTLSGGEQQMVALARALVSGANLLLIDEVSLGLAPVVMAEVVRMIEELARRGTTMLLVEQSLNISLALAQRAYFMERGAIRYHASTEDLLGENDLVHTVFFGANEGSQRRGPLVNP